MVLLVPCGIQLDSCTLSRLKEQHLSTTADTFRCTLAHACGLQTETVTPVTAQQYAPIIL